MQNRNLILGIIVLAANIIFAQEFNINKNILARTPGGARGTAMGRAQTAVGNDIYALAWNPAGLAYVEHTAAMLTNDINFGSTHLSPPQELSDIHNYAVNQKGDFSLNYIGFALPLRMQNTNIVSSIVLQNVTNLHENLAWNITDSKNNNNQLLENSQEGGIFSLSGGVAAQMNSNLAIGLGINLLTGNLRNNIKDNFESESDTLTTWEEWNNKYSGLSVDFGFIWKPNSYISVGSKITFPYTLNITNIEYKNSNEKQLLYDFDAYIKNTTVMAYGVGLHLSENTVLAIDYMIRPWSKAIIYLGVAEMDRYFKDSNSLHIGFEHIFRDNQTQIPIRFGFFTNPEQMTNFSETAEDNLGERVNSKFITGGFGLVFSKFAFNFSMEYNIVGYKVDYLNTLQEFELNQSKINILTGFEFYF